MPLALSITGANRHDSMAFEALIDAIPAVPGLLGRPRKRPYKLHADKVMTSVVAVNISSAVASWFVLPVVVSKAARNWADIVGSSSVPMRGLLASANCACVLNGGLIPITPCSSRLV